MLWKGLRLRLHSLEHRLIRREPVAFKSNAENIALATLRNVPRRECLTLAKGLGKPCQRPCNSPLHSRKLDVP